MVTVLEIVQEKTYKVNCDCGAVLGYLKGDIQVSIAEGTSIVCPNCQNQVITRYTWSQRNHYAE